MTVITGESVHAQPPRKVTVQYPTTPIYEQLLTTPEALLTTEPAVAQISITVTQAMLPKLIGSVYAYDCTAILYCAGKNTSGATQTINYRLLKNGVSMYSSVGAVATNTFWTISGYAYGAVKVGDVLEMRLWSTPGPANFDYKGMLTFIRSVTPMKKGQVMADVTVRLQTPDYDPKYVLTLGIPVATSVGSLEVFYNIDDNNWSSFAGGFDGVQTMEVGALQDKSVAGGPLMLITNGGANTSGQRVNSSTSRPVYYTNTLLRELSYRPLR